MEADMEIKILLLFEYVCLLLSASFGAEKKNLIPDSSGLVPQPRVEKFEICGITEWKMEIESLDSISRLIFVIGIGNI